MKESFNANKRTMRRIASGRRSRMRNEKMVGCQDLLKSNWLLEDEDET